ncbi:MAG: hypothetical protein NC906_03750 [Candidatus Omnitrophica bacterium]|nr:hypothetical protein [Candidatus Omnitrophota bacterium]
MNIEILARLIILVCAGIAVLGFLIGLLVFSINRKKGLVGLLLVVIFAAITGYYSYLFFFPLNTYTVKQQITPQFSISPGQPPVMMVLETEDGSQLIAEDGDYLEIKSNLRIKVMGARQNDKSLENVRINVVGFTPESNPSTTNDIGYFFSYRDMQKRFAIDENKTVFKVEIKKDDEKIAEVFLKFILNE